MLERIGPENMREFEYDWMIVGSGLFGSVFANEMQKKGRSCLVLEKRPHVGGNVHCPESEGIRIHRYGPHVFHTNRDVVWKYVSALVPMIPFINSPLARYQRRTYNLPFNMNTFNQLWGAETPEQALSIIESQRMKYKGPDPQNLEQQALQLVGDDIFNVFIKGYTEKQWGRSASELPPHIIKRIPLRFTYDNNYYNDRYQGIPEGGYDRLIEQLLREVRVIKNVDFLEHRSDLEHKSRRILFSGQIDAFFEYRFGELGYRSLRFEDEKIEKNNFQGNAIVNFTERDIPFTRIIEHRHFESTVDLGHTIITREYPQAWDRSREAFYPVNDRKNNALYERYLSLAKKENPDVIFGGRLGEYRYYNMDEVIERALSLAESF